MINPIELIARSRNRLAKLAAWRVIVAAAAPILVTLAAGWYLNSIAALIWNRWGCLIDPHRLSLLRAAIFLTAVSQMVAAAWWAWSAWRKNRDFAQAAERIDELVGGHQEILTLATFADPARPAEHRSPLFAILWRRAITYLEKFDPVRTFRFEPAVPIGRSSILAVATAIVIGLATVALIRMPSATEAVAYRLRQLAVGGDSPGATPDDRQIAEASRDVAADLENPRIPPAQKLAELEAIKQQLTKLEQVKSDQQSGSGSGKGDGNAAGKGEGGGSGGGNGNGGSEGAGSSPGAKTPGGAGAGGKGDKSNAPSADLQKDLAKAEAKLEKESKSTDSTLTADKQDQGGAGLVPQAGGNPRQPGPDNRAEGNGNVQLPGGGRLAQSEAAPASGNPSAHKNDNGTQGDTHLGDFPKAVAYERYYKIGDKGAAIDLRNARYVTFRLPTDVITTGAEGKTVRDTGAPSAATPYTNAPLKEQRLSASPDEEQLIPPRYRELLNH
ncbi:MAG TPA: hypothetical protein VKS22_13440 [Candidatus Binataceae bacterium]|nr:hypothetical protein [Candidatus Binataceae bacterium]